MGRHDRHATRRTPLEHPTNERHLNQKGAMVPECEAETRNKQALYILENDWGRGILDLGAMQRLLRGDGTPCTCTTKDNT